MRAPDAVARSSLDDLALIRKQADVDAISIQVESSAQHELRPSSVALGSTLRASHQGSLLHGSPKRKPFTTYGEVSGWCAGTSNGSALPSTSGPTGGPLDSRILVTLALVGGLAALAISSSEAEARYSRYAQRSTRTCRHQSAAPVDLARSGRRPDAATTGTRR